MAAPLGRTFKVWFHPEVDYAIDSRPVAFSASSLLDLCSQVIPLYIAIGGGCGLCVFQCARHLFTCPDVL